MKNYKKIIEDNVTHLIKANVPWEELITLLVFNIFKQYFTSKIESNNEFI